MVEFTYWMLWHPRLTNDKAHRWLRALMSRVADEATAAGTAELSSRS